MAEQETVQRVKEPRRVVFQATENFERLPIAFTVMRSSGVDPKTGLPTNAENRQIRPNSSCQYVLPENADFWLDQYRALQLFARKHGLIELAPEGEGKVPKAVHDKMVTAKDPIAMAQKAATAAKQEAARVKSELSEALVKVKDAAGQVEDRDDQIAKLREELDEAMKVIQTLQKKAK